MERYWYGLRKCEYGLCNDFFIFNSIQQQKGLAATWGTPLCINVIMANVIHDFQSCSDIIVNGQITLEWLWCDTFSCTWWCCSALSGLVSGYHDAIGKRFKVDQKRNP